MDWFNISQPGSGLVKPPTAAKYTAPPPPLPIRIPAPDLVRHQPNKIDSVGFDAYKPAPALVSTAHQTIARLIERDLDELPRHWVHSGLRTILSDPDTLRELILSSGLVVAGGVLAALQSGDPPTVAFFKSLPGTLGPRKKWAIYVLVLEKDGCIPLIYFGSGTSASGGVAVRWNQYDNRNALPRYVKQALDDGYEITHKGLLAWTPLPRTGRVPRQRVLFLRMEGALSFVFWGMHGGPKTDEMSYLCHWDIDQLEYDGLCSHTAYGEAGPANIGLTEEQVEAIAAEVKQRQLEYHRWYSTLPEVRQHKSEYNQQYKARPEYKEMLREYKAKPEVQAYNEQYQHAYMPIYTADAVVKADRRTYQRSYMKQRRAHGETAAYEAQYNKRPDVVARKAAHGKASRQTEGYKQWSKDRQDEMNTLKEAEGLPVRKLPSKSIEERAQSRAAKQEWREKNPEAAAKADRANKRSQQKAKLRRDQAVKDETYPCRICNHFAGTLSELISHKVSKKHKEAVAAVGGSPD